MFSREQTRSRPTPVSPNGDADQRSAAASRTEQQKQEEEGEGGASPLLRRSQALGAVLTVLLVGLSVCLLGLLLHKRERR